MIEGGREQTTDGQQMLVAATGNLRPALVRLEGVLAASTRLVGDRFTVADICVAECLRYAQGKLTLLAEFPALAVWLGRCQARPAFMAMLSAELAEPD